jgi:hypothetical protein
MALVEFSLRPLEAIEPWGTPPDLQLHWFGLSDGAYHLDLGDVRLLEYRQAPGWPRYVEYQLARLHEDLLEMVPHVLQALPDRVVALLPERSFGATDRLLGEKYGEIENRGDDLDSAMEALRVRALDSLYLQPGFGVWVWSVGTTVVIEWDNRDRLVEGSPAWTASVGRHEVDRSTFLREVKAFDQRLMSAMEERIQTIARGWQRPDVKVDISSLRADHADRATWFSSALKRQAPAIDWQAIERGLSR